MTDLQVVPAPPDALIDRNDVHVMCCRDGTVTMCGFRWEYTGAAADDEPVTCAVCAEELHTSFCPLGYACPG